MIHYITTNGVGNAWVANELHLLSNQGIPATLHAMRLPEATFHLSGWARQIAINTRAIYSLPQFSLAWSLISAPCRYGRRFVQAAVNSVFGERENLRGRIAGIVHFAVACHWARTLAGEPVTHIHSQWINSCGTIGMYGAWLLDVPFSFTGHAADLFRDRVALKDKIRRAKFIVCISKFHQEFYLQNGARPEQLILAYCGIDPTHFHPVADEQPRDNIDQGAIDRRNGVHYSSSDRTLKQTPPPTTIGSRTPQRPVTILGSGRLVAKKGFAHLIDACAELAKRGKDFRCIIAGSGPLRDALAGQIDRKSLNHQIQLTGKVLPQEHIPEFMHQGDIFCLPCVWAADGDVDGLPQMLMEAMACGLPVISTRLVGIPDLVIHEETGLLVSPNRPDELADAIERLMKDRNLADRLARAGREHVLKNFDIRTCLEPLIEQFRLSLGIRQDDHRRDAEVAESVAR